MEALRLIQISFASNGDWKEKTGDWNSLNGGPPLQQLVVYAHKFKTRRHLNEVDRENL